MDGCDAKPFHCRDVLTDGIALMFRKTIARIFGLEPQHQRVALGDCGVRDICHGFMTVHLADGRIRQTGNRRASSM